MGSAVVAIFLLIFQLTRGQCPWSSDLSALHSACSCSSSGRPLTVQCSFVSLSDIASALTNSTNSSLAVNVTLLYITNGSVSTLDHRSLSPLRVVSLQLSECGLKEVEKNAFQGQQNTVESLGFQDNQLERVPTEPLRTLTALTNLDLSRNQIKIVAKSAFLGPPIQVLKLNDNQIQFDNNSMNGLENSLRNLGLKGTGQLRVPFALRRLTTLAFLDLGQNQITKIHRGDFDGMTSLTALNLERNPIASLDAHAFDGIQTTLSSLSLLSASIHTFPVESLNNLTELRVLDVGFNQLESIPDDAFSSMTSLTLLALDGNPLTTLSVRPFMHLNSTLRGLSVGGRNIICDCRLGWILNWVHEYDLQVTSRERSPQFCGQPANLRNSNLAHLTAQQLQCQNSTTTTTTTTTTTEIPQTTSTTRQIKSLADQSPPSSTTELLAPSTAPTTKTSTSIPTPTNRIWAPRAVHGQEGASVRLINASRTQSTISISWEPFNVTNDFVSNVRIAFRLFGEPQFKVSKPLPIHTRQFRINNVPDDQCILICVVGGEINNFNSISAEQCREIRAEKINAQADKIVIIASSAAICVAVIVAVVIFVCCSRRRAANNNNNNLNHLVDVPHVGLAEIDSNPKLRDWDTGSIYSTRSIPRARMYHTTDNVANGSIRGDDLGNNSLRNFRSNSVIGTYLTPRNPFVYNKKMAYTATSRSLSGRADVNPWISQIHQPHYNHHNKLKFTHSGNGHEISHR